MKLIVGLGNPGEKYQHTRHNLGFMVVEKFLKDFHEETTTEWSDENKFKADIARITWQPKKGKSVSLVLAKPKTFMNNSGMAVSLISSFHKIAPEDIWIINDELDLPLGSMKIRFGGAAAGHRGVESVMESLGTDKFWRFRMGIGESRNHQEIAKHKVTDVDQFVLDKFSHTDAGKARELIKHGAKAIATALESGMEKAMNQFNTK
ncbi:MAG: aminoacyl-tRNA hydrolase [bacterium]|nr:aminoacyl-tRNA hydrolase [bacterium]